MSTGKFDKEKPLAGSMRRDEEDYMNRAQRLAETAPDLDGTAPDKEAGKSHKPLDDDKAHISQKVYMFPDEFNALRVELHTYWPAFFNTIDPETGVSPAYAMVFDAPNFIRMCNVALDDTQHMDSGNVAGICKAFLNGFRKKRGASIIK